MKEEDKKAFLEDYKKSDVSKKLDMWYYALEQEASWEEIITEISNIATLKQIGKSNKASEWKEIEGSHMKEEDKKELIEEFEKADGSKRLDIWDYALEQQVVWEKIITEMQNIARQQGVDKELEKMAEEEIKKLDEE